MHSEISVPQNPLVRHLRGRATSRAWAPLLDALAALHEVAIEDAPRTPDRHARARDAHARVIQAPVDVVEALPPALGSGSPEHARWFVEAALVWMRFADLAAAEVLHTIPAATLASFPIDLPPSEAAHARLRRALRETFALDEAGLAEIERGLDGCTENLRLKQRITTELRRPLTRDGGSPDAAARLALMERFYGPVPLQPGEVDLVITSTLVFFAIPYEGEALLTPGWAARSAEERARVRDFLRWLRAGDSAKTDRFPAFGAFDRQRLDRALAADIAAALGGGSHAAPSPEVVHEQLAMMAIVVPTAIADQYLLHDAYGHGWQADLCDFATDYRRLVHLSDPLTAESGTYFGGTAAPRLRDAFVARSGATHLDEDALFRFAEADLAGRVGVGVSSLVAEVLADLVEGKFIRLAYPDPERFPSSSLLPEDPIKLDLSVTTTRELVGWWRAPYLALRDQPAARAALAEELAAGGLPQEGLAEAIDRAAARLAERFAPALTDRIPSARRDPSGDDGHIDLFESILLANASLSRELRPFLDAALADHGVDRWRRPDACLDFIVLLLGWFFRRAGADAFWHLDALLRDALRPSLLRLRRALEAEDQGG